MERKRNQKKMNRKKKEEKNDNEINIKTSKGKSKVVTKTTKQAEETTTRVF